VGSEFDGRAQGARDDAQRVIVENELSAARSTLGQNVDQSDGHVKAARAALDRMHNRPSHLESAVENAGRDVTTTRKSLAAQRARGACGEARTFIFQGQWDAARAKIAEAHNHLKDSGGDMTASFEIRAVEQELVTAIRQAAVNQAVALLNQAQSMAESDPDRADQLANEARNVLENNGGAGSMMNTIESIASRTRAERTRRANVRTGTGNGSPGYDDLPNTGTGTGGTGTGTGASSGTGTGSSGTGTGSSGTGTGTSSGTGNGTRRSSGTGTSGSGTGTSSGTGTGAARGTGTGRGTGS
jgi:hypothetical protein